MDAGREEYWDDDMAQWRLSSSYATSGPDAALGEFGRDSLGRADLASPLYRMAVQDFGQIFLHHRQGNRRKSFCRRVAGRIAA